MTKQAKQVYKPCQCGESDCPDTKLVQSAPELLEACERALLYINVDHKGIREQLTQAIKNAKGEV